MALLRRRVGAAASCAEALLHRRSGPKIEPRRSSVEVPLSRRVVKSKMPNMVCGAVAGRRTASTIWAAARARPLFRVAPASSSIVDIWRGNAARPSFSASAVLTTSR